MSRYRGRKPTCTDHGRNDRAFHVTGTWPDGGTARHLIGDKARARRRAKEWAAKGATAVLEERGPHGAWKTIRTYYPPGEPT